MRAHYIHQGCCQGSQSSSHGQVASHLCESAKLARWVWSSFLVRRSLPLFICSRALRGRLTGTVPEQHVLPLGRSRQAPGKLVNQNCQNRTRILVNTITPVQYVLLPIRIGLYLREAIRRQQCTLKSRTLGNKSALMASNNH